MKRMVFSLSFLLFVSGMYAQITLEECQRKTQENYPLVHQYGLVEKTKEYNLENAAKGYLPQFALSAKASYQSDVTELPVKIPGVELKRLPKDQYQVMLELQQKIWDGGGIRQWPTPLAALNTLLEHEQYISRQISELHVLCQNTDSSIHSFIKGLYTKRIYVSTAFMELLRILAMEYERRLPCFI